MIHTDSNDYFWSFNNKKNLHCHLGGRDSHVHPLLLIYWNPAQGSSQSSQGAEDRHTCHTTHNASVTHQSVATVVPKYISILVNSINCFWDLSLKSLCNTLFLWRHLDLDIVINLEWNQERVLKGLFWFHVNTKVQKCVCMLRFLSEMCAPPAAASRVGPVEGPGAAGTLCASDSRWAALVRGDGPSVADRSSWEISQEDTSGRSSKAPDGLNHQDMHLVFLLIKSPHLMMFHNSSVNQWHAVPSEKITPRIWHRPVD